MGFMKKRVLTLLILVFCMVLTPLSAFARINEHNGPPYGLPPSEWQNIRRPLSLHENENTNGAYGEYTNDDDDSENNIIVMDIGRWFAQRELPSRQQGLNIQGLIPWMLPEFESYYTINEHINKVMELLIGDARRVRARSITFDYEIYPTSEMVSVLIKASVSSVISRTLVRSINFCPHTGEFLTARDAFYVDVIPLAEAKLALEMRRSPEHFYLAQTISLGSQAFFVTDYGITILFDEFQLSSMVSGVFPLELLFDKIRTATISLDELLQHDHAYNIPMVPLRSAGMQLGYDVRWVNRRAEVSLITENGERDLRIWAYPGINEYHVSGHSSRSLEAAPERRLGSGQIYVPITFFEQILPLSVYNRDSYGNITFLAYIG